LRVRRETPHKDRGDPQAKQSFSRTHINSMTSDVSRVQQDNAGNG
jgi:hypothetical protein